MKQTRTALKVLTDRYRAVLLHCLAGLIVAVFPMTARSAGLDGCTDADCTLTLSADKTIDGTATGTKVNSNQTVEGNRHNLTLNGKWIFSDGKEYTFSNIRTFANDTMKISGNMTIKDSNIVFKTYTFGGATTGTQIDAAGTLIFKNVKGTIENIAGGGKLIVDADSEISVTNALLVNTIENGGEITLDTSSIGMNISTNIKSYNDTTNGTGIVKGGWGATFERTLTNKLTVDDGSKATFKTTANLPSNTLTVNGSLIFSEENSSFNANDHSWSGSGAVQMANGMKIQGNFGSVGVSLTGDASAAGNIETTGDFSIGSKVFDLGKRTIAANTVKNGKINITLPASGNVSSILNANVDTVTVSLDLSALKKKTVEKYIFVADGKTLNDLLLNYDSGKYAISETEFERKDAKNKADLNNVALTSGSVYIALKMGSGEQAVSDLIDGGEDVTPTDEKTGDIVDEIDDNTINDALDNADLKDKKNILREVGLDTSNTHIAVSTARTILDTVFARLANVSEQPRYNPYYENLLRNKAVSYKGKGRSGGDYVAGRASLWARGLVNKTKFDGEYAFDADSKGFAAGLEGSPAEDWKFGAGYAYTSTDVDSDRSKTDAETNAAFVYARYKPESFYFNAVGTFGHTKFKDETKILKLKSEYETDTFSAQAVAGYDFGGISPEVGVRYTSVKQDEYKTGLDLTVQSKTMEFATAVAGIRAGMTQYLRLNRKVAVHSEIKALATYDWMRDDEIRMVSLPDNSATYAMKGEPFARFGGEVGADVFFTFGRAGEIVLTYDGKFKKDYQDHTGMVSLKINF